jgi:hypothetical protein
LRPINIDINFDIDFHVNFDIDFGFDALIAPPDGAADRPSRSMALTIDGHTPADSFPSALPSSSGLLPSDQRQQ